jgi:hypothetical protein
MKYRVEVPGPTSDRYVKRTLTLMAEGGWGWGYSTDLPAEPGLLEFDSSVPHFSEMVGVMDAPCFSLHLVEQNSTQSRTNTIELTPVRLDET